jgi:hypothetical protein
MPHPRKQHPVPGCTSARSTDRSGVNESGNRTSEHSQKRNCWSASSRRGSIIRAEHALWQKRMMII